MAVCEITHAGELRDLYPIIELGVNSITAKQEVAPNRIAADVYHKILNGELKLLISHSDDTIWGWCTCYTNGITGICEDMYIIPGAPPYILPELVDTLEKFIQGEGAKELVFTSTRLAWGRKLKNQGYQMKCYVFGKEF